MKNFKGELNRLLDSIVDEAMEFAKRVHPLFVKNNWTYWSEGIPEASSIAANAVELVGMLRHGGVNEHGFGCASSGRIQVRVTNYGDLTATLELVPVHKRISTAPCLECDGEGVVDNPEWNADKRQCSVIKCPACSE